MDLAGDERLDERVRGLRVQTQRVPQTLQLGRLFQECLFQSISAGVEVLLDCVQRHIKYSALIRREILLNLGNTEEE